MNKNKQANRFEIAPMMNSNITRTQMTIKQRHKTTFNMGKLIPVYLDMDVLPNHTKQITLDYVCRMTTPKVPVMDDLFIDFHAFFVPNRIVCNEWRQIMGENKLTEWVDTTEYTVPQMIFNGLGSVVQKGQLADYLGIPLGYAGSVSALPFRAYKLIHNEWYRNQNVSAPFIINTSAANTYYDGNWKDILDTFKLADFFTTALPDAQKGASVLLPLSATTQIPVKTTGDTTFNWESGIAPIHLKQTSTGLPVANKILGSSSVGNLMTSTVTPTGFTGDMYIDNLYADVSAMIAGTVNAQRTAFQIQGILEMDARGGTRYNEIIKNQFGINMPDAQWRPEYIGGKRFPINIAQVIQNSETGTTPLGTTAGYSLTSGRVSFPTKSFCEHGMYFIMATVRQLHTYQQGLEKGWTRKRRYDFYMPPLAHLGEQPIYTEEIYATGVEANDKTVFGYQEAWSAGYRYRKNHITGAFRSTYTTPLDIWHYGDKYEDAPVLSEEFCKETPTFVDRTIQIPSTTEDQFIIDMHFKDNCVLPMPMYSIPGMLDHF